MLLLDDIALEDGHCLPIYTIVAYMIYIEVYDTAFGRRDSAQGDVCREG
jgi:hypothetical protein